MFFGEKKTPGRAAPNRRPSWGCTKTPIAIKIHWKSTKIQKSTPRQPSLFLSLKRARGERASKICMSVKLVSVSEWSNQAPCNMKVCKPQENSAKNAESELGDKFYGWRDVDYWILVDFQLILMEMGVLVHPQLSILCGAALPTFFS